MARLILASGSQTRAEMLKNAGVDFSIHNANVDEEPLKMALMADKVPARDIADALAELKARTVSYLHPEAIVIGADQILAKGDQIFSKAKDREDAHATLQGLSDSTHQLFSAAVVYQNGQAIWRHVDSTKMTVRPLSDTFIEGYLDHLGDDAFWSVGCYQLEGMGAQLFTKVDGDFFTVLGLPLFPLLDFLRRHGLMPI